VQRIAGHDAWLVDPLVLAAWVLAGQLVAVAKAALATTPTPTPTPPAPALCVPIPCGGSCAIPAPCTPGTICPEGPVVLAPGTSIEQTLDITGTEWLQETTAGGECGTCTQKVLAPGTYTVVARFQYSTNIGNPWLFPDHIVASAEFGWPE